MNSGECRQLHWPFDTQWWTNVEMHSNENWMYWLLILSMTHDVHSSISTFVWVKWTEFNWSVHAFNAQENTIHALSDVRCPSIAYLSTPIWRELDVSGFVFAFFQLIDGNEALSIQTEMQIIPLKFEIQTEKRATRSERNYVSCDAHKCKFNIDQTKQGNATHQQHLKQITHITKRENAKISTISKNNHLTYTEKKVYTGLKMAPKTENKPSSPSTIMYQRIAALIFEHFLKTKRNRNGRKKIYKTNQCTERCQLYLN